MGIIYGATIAFLIPIIKNWFYLETKLLYSPPDIEK